MWSFQGEVTVTNPGTQTVTQAWNSTVTQSGAVATFRNAAWNGTLAPGGSTTFGFLGSGASTPNPTASF